MDVILRTEGLCKEFAGFKAVSDVNLSVRRGSVHALIGPNGAGKTTVFNLLTRFLSASAGAIYLKGRNITRDHPAAIARSGMVRSFQISAVFPHLSVGHNISIALQRPTGLSFNFLRHDSCLDRLNPQIEALAERFGLADLIDVAAAELPYGRKRALEIATTFALDPDVILLDEPMAGLGQTDIPVVTRMIKALAGSRTVLMVEHNLSVVAEISDCITVLARGSVLAEGTYSEISEDRRVQEAYLGGQDA
jgi:branched-chain amino acid transport system ATP-binding protein